MMKIILICILLHLSLFCDETITKINSDIKKYLNYEEIKYIKNKKIIIGSNEFDYEPMDFNIDKVPIGYSIDLLNILTKSVGLKVEYVTESWTELLKDFETGKIDLMHTIYKNSSRAEKMSFSLPYLVGENSFILNKSSKDVKKIEELRGKRVGVSKGWLEENVINQYSDIKKIYFKDLKEKLNALSSGKIDAIISDKNIAKYYIKKYGFSNIKISNEIIQNDNEELDKYYFATLKEQEILISILNKAYINLDIETLEKLQEKWFGNRNNGKSIFNLKEQRYLDAKEKIKMCIFPNLIPLSHLENGIHQGVVSDILAELKYRTNLDFEIVPTNDIKETLKALKNNLCELIPTLEYSKENSKRFNLTQPYLSIPYVAIGKSDKQFFSDISELSGKKISVISYNSLIKDLEKANPSIKIIDVNTIEEGLNLVKEGKVYAHLTLYPIAKYNIAKVHNDDLKIIGRLLKPLPLCIASNKKDEVLASILQKSINTLPQTKINTILNNWTELKVQKIMDYEFFYKVFGVVLVLVSLGVWRYRVLKKNNKEIKTINSQLHKSQRELKKQKEEFEAIFRYSKDGIAILDSESKFIDFNKAYLNMLGFTKEEMLEKKFIELVVLEEREDIKRIFENVLKKKYYDNFEKVFLGKDSRRISANMTITLMPDKNRVLVTAKDMTSTKLLESQSKLASMGEMIGNIAHQWRQPLSVITTSASGLAVKVDLKQEISEDEILDFSNQIIKQAQYLSKTIDDFRNFIRVDIHYQPISIKQALQNALALTKAAIKSNYITVIENIEDDLIINGNKNELSQAFINIINNAKDKLKEIEEKQQQRLIFVNTKKVNDSTLEIKILDNGGGIEEKIINRIFEPYFTTKHQSVGTGLGLSMSEKIIRERHKGTIQAYNEEFEYENIRYKGACFLIKLSSKNKE